MTKGIKAYKMINGERFYSVDREYKNKRDSETQAKNIRRGGGKARVIKYSFGYVVYGRA